MKEIKFKAWDGQLMHTVDTIEWTVAFGRWYGSAVGSGIFWINKDFNNWQGEPKKINSILLEYTRSKDKEGTEIYEGDIIQSVSNIVNVRTKKPTGEISIRNYIVKWEDEQGRWGRWNILKNRFERLSGLKQSYLDQWYIKIGNIYEDPELLKEIEI